MTYEEYEKISLLLINHLRRQEHTTEEDTTVPILERTGAGMKQKTLVNWYLNLLELE